MRNLFLFLRSVRHTHARQLLARARLVVKRKAFEKLGRRFDLRGGLTRGAEPAVSARIPGPVFAARRDLVEDDEDDLCLAFVNVRHRLVFPIDWRPESWRQGTQLEILLLHAMEWLEAVPDPIFVAAVEDWIANVPPYRPEYARHEWNSYALSIRTVVWMQQLAARRRLPLAFVDVVTRSLVEQTRFLERNLEVDIGGNHLIKNIKALLWAGRFFDGPEAQRWARRGERLLAHELDLQFLSDGMHFERSPAYHSQVCADLIECRVAITAGPVATRLAETLDRAIQALGDVTHPDGRVSLFNDGGLHIAYSPAEIITAHERCGGAAPVARTHVALDAAGYFGYREGKTYVLVDCGAIAPDHLPAHGHGDALSFEWSVHGERIFVDPGVFEYHPGPMRAYSRSTKAHNTVTLDDQDQCEFWSAFRMGRRAHVSRKRLQTLPDGFVVEGLHDGFAHLAGEPIHRRIIRATAQALAIEDHVEGGAGQAACARLLCHPTARLAQSKDGSITITQGRVQVRVVSESPMRIVEIWWCPDFGLKLRTKQIVVSYGTAPRVGAISVRSLVPAVQSLIPNVKAITAR